MAKSNKTALVYLTGTETWKFLRLINTDVVEPHNEFSGARAPPVPYGSDVQVSGKHESSDTFDREKFYEKYFGKGELHYIC